MSAETNQKTIQTDWSVKDLNEIERKNLLGFFVLLLKVDKRVNPHLYKKQNGNIGSSDNTNKAK